MPDARPDHPIGAIVDELFHLSRAAPPVRFQEMVATTARHLDGTEVAVYLQDFEQRFLHHLGGGEVLPIDGTSAGRAFAADTAVVVEGEGGARLWLPLVDGAERLGVLGVTLPDVAEWRRRECERWAALVTHLLLAQEQYTDLFHAVRRRQPMSLAAEMQWQLLPPLVFSTEELAIAGIVEPAYDVGGDIFDYAYDGRTLRTAVLDAMGHGVQASLTSTIAVAAYRHARREGHDLARAYEDIDAVVAEHRPSGFATGILADLDRDTGRLRWLNAGHPRPTLLRGGRAHDLPGGEPALPLGVASALGDLVAPPSLHEVTLEPGDRVLLYTDGAVDARDTEGRPFGADRLVELLLRLPGELGLAETLRQLVQAVLAHTGGGLLDDATVVLLEYRAGTEPPSPSGTGPPGGRP